jgi:predicted secreted Zn-dependent protease
VSDTGFKYQLVCRNGLSDIDVAAFFSPSGSWVKLDAKSPELLRHEQGHFDMAELYALKLRKAILDAKTNCGDAASANGEKMVSEFQKQWQDAEREYEQDTRFGTDLGKQDAASERITADLEAMSAYKN